ncbi:MAG: NAD(P)-dependent oxidoreductase [bacterium]
MNETAPRRHTAELPPPTLRVLLTGDRGHTGRWLRRRLERDGHQVVGFDIRDGHDIRDDAAVASVAAKTDVIIHCATLQWDHSGGDDDILHTNVRGAANVLAAAERAKHDRVVMFSSIQVLGVTDNSREPRSFPIRDSHERQPRNAYARSKAEIEDLCATFTARTGITTLCPRPVHIFVPGQAADTRRRWKRQPDREWVPAWGYGGFVDVRDVCSAVALAISVPVEGHHRFILCAADAAASVTTLEAIQRFRPDVPCDANWPPTDEPNLSLFDTARARDLLGWAPVHTWAEGFNETLLTRAKRRLRQPFPV